MSNKAVRRLHSDIHNLHQAQKGRQSAAHKLNQAKHELKSERKRINHQKDQFEKDQKSLGSERASLTDMKQVESMLLKPLDLEEQKLQTAYDQSVDPTTGQGDANIKAQLDALNGLDADLKGMLDTQISGQQQQVAALKAAVQKGRLDVKHSSAEIKHDKTAVKHDTKALAHAKNHVKADRKKALDNLRPAEYQLGLKSTNEARHELGLKSVHHVVRAGPENVTPTMRRLAADGHAVAMSMGGYVSHGLCATGVSAAIQRATGIKVYGNGNQIDNNLPRSKFKQIHIPLAKALKIPGLILTWEHTSTAAGSLFGHTAITTGDGHSSCSDFIERDTLAGNRSRTGLKIFMPIG